VALKVGWLVSNSSIAKKGDSDEYDHRPMRDWLGFIFFSQGDYQRYYEAGSSVGGSP
jgi:hypothetical protein